MTLEDLGWPVAGLLGLFGGGGVWGWLSARAKLKAEKAAAIEAAPAVILASQATFQAALTAQAEVFIKALQEELGHRANRVHALERRVEEVEREAADCLGRERDMHQRIDSLERQLEREGRPPPRRRPKVLKDVVTPGPPTKGLEEVVPAGLEKLP